MNWLAALVQLTVPVAASTQPVAAPPIATLEALASGAAACATQKLSQEKMANRLIAMGWHAGAASKPEKSMAMTVYRLDGVTLSYFTSKPMTQCVVRGTTAKDFRPDPLVEMLTAQLGKVPKIDEPGRRYLYSLPRLKILTLQIKADAAAPRVELSVVH